MEKIRRSLRGGCLLGLLVMVIFPWQAEGETCAHGMSAALRRYVCGDPRLDRCSSEIRSHANSPELQGGGGKTLLAGRQKIASTYTENTGQSQEAALLPAEGSAIPPQWRGSVRSVIPEGNRKILALTFDLCESARGTSGYDAPLVSYLREHGIKATFYAGGKWMRSHPEEAMYLMADPLFEVGNHSWDHAHFRLLDHAEMERQILETQAEYRKLRDTLIQRPDSARAGSREADQIPLEPLSFRFPYGTCNREGLELLARLGLPAIQWSVVTGDPDPHQNAEGIARVVLREAHPGSIIIGHANGRGHGTAQALSIFIPKLQQQGYTFVTVSELLSLGAVQASPSCYERIPGDNLRYDRNPPHQRTVH